MSMLHVSYSSLRIASLVYEAALTSYLFIEGRDLASQFGCKFVETSAKAKINVDNAFYDLVREIRKYNKDMSGYHGGGQGKTPDHKMEMSGEDQDAGCCGKCVIM